MNQFPLISIALPVYNGASTLEFALKSILNQTYENWELFILNDGSTDKSMIIANSFKDSRIQILDDGVNLGLIQRLNSVPALANGKYIARMDADDIMHPERLKLQVEHLEQNPEIDVIDCTIYIIDEHNQVQGIRNEGPLYDSKISLLTNCLFTHPAVLGKKAWFERNLYETDFYRAEDYELWIRTFDSSKFDRVMKPLLYYREGNVSISNYKNSMKSVRKIFRKYGPSLIADAEQKKLIMKSHLKEVLYQVFGFFKLQKKLAAMRNHPVGLADRINAQAVLDHLKL